MRAIEEMVEAVIQALAETGRLENTYLIFTSDNGLLMGQHRLPHNTLALRTKDWLYAELATDELELYDMRTDPYQLESLHRDADPMVLDEFSKRIQTLLACRGIGCRQ